LRRLKGAESLFSYILKELKLKEDSSDALAVNYHFENGGFLFFFDGYDEVTDAQKSNVSNAIDKFVEDYFNGNRFFLTSRPEPGLVEFGGFAEFYINGLEEEESYKLIKKYDRSNEVSDLLIKKLKSPQFVGLKDFLKNPLLTSLLYRAFEYKNKIPIRKNQFYRQVYDANFEAHDLTKGGAYSRPKKSNLDTEDFHRILRYVGFDCFQSQQVEFESKDKILSVISEAKKYYNISTFKPIDFLEDLLKSVPLFSKDGSYYKWNHRSLQEYFASQFIFMDSKNEQSAILLKIYNHNSLRYYFNTLELYADTDPVSFRNIIELEFLREYISYYEDSISQMGRNSDEIKTRVDHLFFRKIKIAQDSNPVFLQIHSAFELDNLSEEEDELEIDDNILMDLHKLDLSNDKHNGQILNWRTEGIVTWPRFSLNTFMSIYSNIKGDISEILFSMGRKYIKKKFPPDYYHVEIDLKSDYQDKVFELNFDPQMWFNQGIMLSKINELLALNRGYYEFDIELVREEIHSILNFQNGNQGFIKF